MDTKNAQPRPFPAREQKEFRDYFRVMWKALSETVSYQLDEIEVTGDEVKVSFLTEDGEPGETFYARPRRFDNHSPHGWPDVLGFYLSVEIEMPARGMEPPYLDTFFIEDARNATQAAAALAVMPAKRICAFAMDAETDRRMNAAEKAHHESISDG
jgi:hypothetical protein